MAIQASSSLILSSSLFMLYYTIPTARYKTIRRVMAHSELQSGHCCKKDYLAATKRINKRAWWQNICSSRCSNSSWIVPSKEKLLRGWIPMESLVLLARCPLNSKFVYRNKEVPFRQRKFKKIPLRKLQSIQDPFFIFLNRCLLLFYPIIYFTR